MDYDNLTSLPAMFFANTSEIGDRPFLWAKCGGDWRPTTGSDAFKKATALTNALASLGVSKGDRVALIAESRPEWLIADIAIMAAGGISVPAYTTNQVGDHVHILRDSGAKAAIVSDRRWQRTFCPRRRKSPRICDHDGAPARPARRHEAPYLGRTDINWRRRCAGRR